MAWVETRSPSFAARHDSRSTDGAREVLDALEGFRADLGTRFPEAPAEIAVVLHASWAQLVLAQPWLPLAQLASAPAARRYFGGWFSAGELHVLTPRRLRERASGAQGSREAMRRAPLHEYAHLAVGAANPDLPPPFGWRSFRAYLRWAWLCEGAATFFSGQHDHLHAAVARRLREGPRPELPPSPRDAMLLGGSLFALLAAEKGERACVQLVRQPLEGTDPQELIERAFGRPIDAVASDWRDQLEELVAAGSRRA